jgi:SMP-30/Gluconolactonase/LRE-like region
MDRRAFLAASAVTASGVALRAAAAATEGPFGATAIPVLVPPAQQLPLGPLPSTRYPDTHVESLDKRFKGSVGTGAVERVATGFRWAEGPAYFAAGHYLLFSDIPNNRMMRVVEDDGRLSVFRSPSMNSNGNTTDRQGRLVSCEHGGRRVVRTEFDGTATMASGSIRQTTSWSPPTAQSGSQIRLMASAASTRDFSPSRNRKSVTSIGSIRRPEASLLSSMTSSSPTGSASRRTRRSCTSSTAASPMAVHHISVPLTWTSTRARIQ